MVEQPRRVEPHLHDGQLGRPRLLQADPPAGGHARPDGQPEGRDHRAAREGELHGGPGRRSSTSPRPTAPARASPTRRCAPRTPGYLTRRLVDVAQDVIIRIEDCGTDEYVELPLLHQRRPERDAHRAHRGARRGPGGHARSLEAGQEITREALAELAGGSGNGNAKASAEGVAVRSVLKCHAPHGRLQGLLRPRAGDRQDGADRRRGRHHRRPVDRRARHAADHADLPHRRRRRRGHHARPAARGGAVRGAQAQGPGQDGRVRGRRRPSRTPTRPAPS